MAGAQGTFGLVATTSLQPGAIALAADRQPLFIGADPENGLLIYASEAAALKVAGEPEGEGWVRPVPFRCDLRDGDIALLQVVAGTADNTITLVNRYRDGAPVVERITTERLAASAGATPGPAADAPTATALRGVTLTDNPLITSASGTVGRRRRRDRVLNGMSDIPRVLALVRRVWDDPASPNRQTAASFVAEFFARSEAGKVATAPTGASSRVAGIDVLLLGVVNSLYLAERFANDLARVSPRTTRTRMGMCRLPSATPDSHSPPCLVRMRYHRHRLPSPRGSLACAADPGASGDAETARPFRAPQATIIT